MNDYVNYVNEIEELQAALPNIVAGLEFTDEIAPGRPMTANRKHDEGWYRVYLQRKTDLVTVYKIYTAAPDGSRDLDWSIVERDGNFKFGSEFNSLTEGEKARKIAALRALR